jgi:hypothetical protein
MGCVAALEDEPPVEEPFELEPVEEEPPEEPQPASAASAAQTAGVARRLPICPRTLA